MKPLPSLVILAILSLVACKKSSDDGPAAGTMGGISGATATVNSIIATASVIHPGHSATLSRGFCWSNATATPTIDTCAFIKDLGKEKEFTDTIKGLYYGTQYYVRAFESNETDVAYGPTDTVFTLPSPFTAVQPYQGGYIVYIDSTGEHGLIACGAYSSGAWETYNDIVAVSYPSVATSYDIGYGQENTRRILAAGIVDPKGAAAYCDQLVYENYDDWFLPSYFELVQLHLVAASNWSLTFHYPGNLYWSSTQSEPGDALLVPINAIATAFFSEYKSEEYPVVAFRKF